MKKIIGIIVFIIVVIISLGLSIYLPNKDKINDKTEDKSIIYSVIEENGKYGVKNQENKVIVKPQYEQVVIPNEHRGIFICDNDGEKTVVYNEKGSEIFKDYDAVEPIKLSNLLEKKYERNAIIYQKNGKYGLLSITGKVILDARYEQIYSLGYKENEVIVKDNNKYKIYDVKGKQLIKDEFDLIQSDEYYNEQDGYKKSGYIVCKITSEGYRYGYYDYDYDEVLTLEYNQILRIVDIADKNNIYLIASKNGQYGVFINNAKIINTQYQSINYEKEFNLFIAERTGKYGAFNEKGTEILKVNYDTLEVKGMYIYTTKGDEQKVFDKEGKEISIPFNTTIEKTDNDNIFIKYENNKYGVIDKENKVLVNCEYDLLQIIRNTKAYQAVNFETNTTYIFNNKFEKVIELQNATINVENGKITVYNESNNYKLDNNGNIILDN